MTGFEDLPLLAEADVIVCGGGTAGVFAAIAAAEQDASVLLLEHNACVGGTATQALVTPLMSLRMPEDVTCSYLSQRMGNVRNYDPVILGWELEKMCLAAGVQILYHITLCDAICENGTLREVVLACKKGLVRVRARYLSMPRVTAICAALPGLLTIRAPMTPEPTSPCLCGIWWEVWIWMPCGHSCRRWGRKTALPTPQKQEKPTIRSMLP